MKFHTGDKVYYMPKTNREYAWELKLLDEYIITNHAFDMRTNDNTMYVGVRNKKGIETTWYDENDFLSIYEYRKYKLNKINGQKNKF